MLSIASFASADQWIQKADFIGMRSRGVAFAINQKGYVGTGYSNQGIIFKDFWCYNSVNNSWTQVADLPGAERMDAFGFELGGKGYVGCGNENVGSEKDFWEFNPSTNSWIQKADFPDVRFSAVAFSIGSKGYVGTGTAGWGSVMRDFWQYDSVFDSWVSKADFCGGPISHAIGLVIGNLGYVGIGNGQFTMTMEFWQFNPLANSWTQKSNFAGSPRNLEMGFTLNSRGYVLGGDSIVFGAGTIQTKTNWEYTTDSLDAINELTFSEIGLEIFPNPVRNFLTIHSKHPVIISIYTEEGKEVIKNLKCENALRLDAQSWAAGIYYLKVELNNLSLTHSLVKE